MLADFAPIGQDNMDTNRCTGKTQRMLEYVLDVPEGNVCVVAHNHMFATELWRIYAEMLDVSVIKQLNKSRLSVSTKNKDVRFLRMDSFTGPTYMPLGAEIVFIDHYAVR
jgi:hypothetical protein